ncbi:MAG: GNAT family N-acetyltransferase [Acidobacteria bacterium]|nr:GNAT family N-acetyltransferase [Acidobacteriota bacterium]
MPQNPDLASWKPVALPNPQRLAGQFVHLAPLRAERHVAELWKGVEGHDEVWDYLSDGPYGSEAELRSALEAKESGSSAVFLTIIPVSSASVEGYASYMRMDPANGVIEVGNIMMTPSLQKTTAATEAMYLMARHIFEDLGYRRYEWKCNANNVPSRRAALRYGFTFEGIFRQHMIIKGRNRDTAWFSMLDTEWPQRKAAFEAWLKPANFDSEGQQRQSLAEIAAKLR